MRNMRPFCDYQHSGGFGLFIRLVGLWLEVTCIKWNDNKLVHVYEKRETEPFDHCIGTASRVSRQFVADESSECAAKSKGTFTRDAAPRVVSRSPQHAAVCRKIMSYTLTHVYDAMCPCRPYLEKY